MKASLSLDQFADVSALTDKHPPIDYIPGLDKPVAIFSKGSIFEGPMALQLCRTGQAVPADDECAKALGLTEEQIESKRIEYTMNTLGIWRDEDRDLYRAGVIAGYDKDLNYIHGPNWAKYQAARQAVSSTEDDI